LRILSRADRAALWGVILLAALLAGWVGWPKPPPVAPLPEYRTWINPNSATLEQLDELPGIGHTLALLILERRQRDGPYQALEELMEIPGIGAASVEKLRPWLTFDQE